MPPARTPSRVAAGKPPVGRKPPTDGRPSGTGGGSRFFGRFKAAQQRAAAGGSSRSGKSGGNLGTLVRDIRSELKKVEWPTREELVKFTAAIVALSALVGLFLGGVDYIFQEFIKVLISLTNGGV
jgi:preprotein translocase subunit SecE